MSKRVLGVSAHPDDLEWYAGGTVARLEREGCEIVLVVCTDGDKGTYDPHVDPLELVEVRRAEQHAAARALGIREIVFLDHADGELEATAALRKQLARLYRQYRPELLFAFDPWKVYELHPDHVAAGRAALDARIAAKMPLYYPEWAQEGIDAWAIGEIWLFNAERPNHYYDVSESLELQQRALALHHSQRGVWDQAAQDWLTRNATENGKQIGVKYAEAFRRIVIEGALVVAEGTE